MYADTVSGVVWLGSTRHRLLTVFEVFSDDVLHRWLFYETLTSMAKTV